jgi:formylglycine-generating enzyme required for sulfatase activity
MDVAGNLREWTGSIFKPYPYDPSDGRERAESIDIRVLRGGSWDRSARYARAAFRGIDDGVGFRLVFAVPARRLFALDAAFRL